MKAKVCRPKVLGTTFLMTIVALAAGVTLANCDCPKCRAKRRCVDGHVRAGCPQNISCFARPSILPHECGYYVGGGAPCNEGEARYGDEGTWGWDYFGMLGLKKVALNWYHGERYQGGTGAYKTDGPKCEHGH
jgi:hypothetical protein